MREVRAGGGVVRYLDKKKPEPKEIAAAYSIASKYGSKIFLRGKNAAGADALIDGVQWEIKTLNKGTANAVSNNIQEAVKNQSSRVVIDGRTAGLTEEAMNAGLAKAERFGNGPTELIVIYSDDVIVKVY